MGRARRGEGARLGDAPGRKGAAAAFLPPFRLGMWKSAGAVREKPQPGVMPGANSPACCLREGVGESQREEARGGCKSYLWRGVAGGTGECSFRGGSKKG